MPGAAAAMLFVLFRSLRRVALVGGLGLLVGQCSPKNSEVVPAPVARTDFWEVLPAPSQPRNGGAVVALANGQVLMCGGLRTDGSGLAPDTEIYNPAANTWRRISGGPTTVGLNLLLLRNGDVLAYGGNSSVGGSIGMVWRYLAATERWQYVGQTGFLNGQQFVEHLEAAAELRDGRVVLGTSNRLNIVTGTTLRQFTVTNWGDPYYHGTALLGLPNGNFIALWNAVPPPSAELRAEEYNPDEPTGNPLRRVPRWFNTTTNMRMTLLTDSTALALGGNALAQVNNFGAQPFILNLRTGATTDVRPAVGLDLVGTPNALVKISGNRYAALSLADTRFGMAIFDPATRQWQANYDSFENTPHGRPASTVFNSMDIGGYRSFVAPLPNDDLLMAGPGVVWRVKKH